ncbi:transposase [Nafulsella turpanensis]|uniref:transposase n=1 Tax=Nafulsella turpanensis TaxID=1265690 RepID=UPI00034CFEE2|nr:transposase [Nafulsella turpanensis]
MTGRYPPQRRTVTDAESRALILHRNIVEVSYNTQTAVDSRHNLILHYQATNKNDFKALFPVALAAKQVLGKASITVLADKGYFNGQQLSQCEEQGIITIVAFKEPRRQSAVPTAEYLIDKFSYDKEKDEYTCPRGKVLRTNGSVYKKSTVCEIRKNPTPYTVKHYKTKACMQCEAKSLCTNNKYGRLVERNEYTEPVGRNNQRVIKQQEVYRKRQAIVEHPFGTIKRGWGYTFTLLKGLEKVDGEMGIIFTVYNLRRAVSILSVPKLLELLKGWRNRCFASFSDRIRDKLSPSAEVCFEGRENQLQKMAA